MQLTKSFLPTVIYHIHYCVVRSSCCVFYACAKQLRWSPVKYENEQGKKNKDWKKHTPSNVFKVSATNWIVDKTVVHNDMVQVLVYWIFVYRNNTILSHCKWNVCLFARTVNHKRSHLKQRASCNNERKKNYENNLRILNQMVLLSSLVFAHRNEKFFYPQAETV